MSEHKNEKHGGGVGRISVCDGESVVEDECDEARVCDLALSKLSLEPGMTMLDVGCSTKRCVVRTAKPIRQERLPVAGAATDAWDASAAARNIAGSRVHAAGAATDSWDASAAAGAAAGATVDPSGAATDTWDASGAARTVARVVSRG